MNPDGIAWVKINNITYINDEDVITGDMGVISSPAINATCDQPEGHGWWQLDDYEIWDGMPDEEPEDTTPPMTPSGLAVL